METKRTKDEIKELKYWLRVYKKELKEAHKSEDWGALEYLSEKVNNMQAMLEVKTKEYKKE